MKNAYTAKPHQDAAVAFLMFATAVLAAMPAFADSPSVLCEVALIAQGNMGQALAMMAILILGVGALFGKVSWGLAILAGVGIAVIFQAGTIVNLVTHKSLTCIAH